MFDLSGRVALVTDANTGNGQSIALALAGRSGAKETISGIRGLGRNAVFIELDLSSTEPVPGVVTQTLAELGGLNILRRQDNQHRLDAELSTRYSCAKLYCFEIGRRGADQGFGERAAKGLNVKAIAPGYIATNNTAALQADQTRNRQIIERIPAGRCRGERHWWRCGVSCLIGFQLINGHILAVDGEWLAQ